MINNKIGKKTWACKRDKNEREKYDGRRKPLCSSHPPKIKCLTDQDIEIEYFPNKKHDIKRL